MSYKIQYKSISNKKYFQSNRKRVNKYWPLLSVLIAVLICVSIVQKPLRSILFPGDPEVTDAATKKMLQSLQEGEGVYEAISAFCLEVIENGQQNSR